MKNKTSIYICAVSLVFLHNLPVQGQGFVNLGFENANVSGLTPGAFPVSPGSTVPGWTITFDQFGIDPSTATASGYDHSFNGNEGVSIDDQQVGSALAPLVGNFSAVIDSSGDNLVEASLNQTGMVPVGTQSLLLDAQTEGNPFVVTLGGQTINMQVLQTFANYSLYTGNISSFAGQIEQFTITEPVPPSTIGQPGEGGELVLDNIQFSPSPVPEPGTLALVGLGAWSLIRLKRLAVR